MLFNRFFKTYLLSSLIAIAPAYSSDLTSLKSQAESFSNQLSSFYQANSTIEGFYIDDISHQYLFNHGLVFTVKTNIEQLLADQRSQGHKAVQQAAHQVSKNEHSNDSRPELTTNDELAQLRLTARNLAHQEFSLQRQLESMQSSSLQSAHDEEKKSTIDKKIRINQDKMNSLIKERAAVSQQIANIRIQQTMSENSTPPLSRAQLYKTMLKQTYQLLCDDQELHPELADKEQLTVIFEGLGDADNTDHKDYVVSIEKTTIAQCNNNEISIQQAINDSQKYQY